MTDQRGRRVTVCPACGEPIRDDEPGAITDAGTVVHRRCGGADVPLSTFAGP